MRSRTFFILIMFLAVAFPLFAQERDKGMHPAKGFFLPSGNLEGGKAAFVRLRCNACHWVQNEIGFPQPVAQDLGPVLGAKQAGYSRGWLASSIISPSHTIAAGSNGRTEGGEASRMSDFTQVMTVRELIDIVEYIKSLKKADDA